MTFDRWRANITGPEVRGLYCPPFRTWWKGPVWNHSK